MKIMVQVQECVSCCDEVHEIIQWTDAGPRQYGAECPTCGKRCAAENPKALRRAWNSGAVVVGVGVTQQGKGET